VRVPLADSTLVKRPAALPALEALLLGDVVATGSFIARRAGVGPETGVAVVGLGAVGLAAVIECRRLGAAWIAGVDVVPERLAFAAHMGAQPVPATGAGGEPRPAADIAKELAKIGGGEGAAVAIEAAGGAAALQLAAELLRPGGVLSVGAVHFGEQLALPADLSYGRNLTLQMGRCPARSGLEELCALQLRDRLPIASLVTHRLPLSAAADAYRLFDERREGMIKCVLVP
jgi:threonine dehydrogenase-like Zn-dependent dehydrogenase